MFVDWLFTVEWMLQKNASNLFNQFFQVLEVKSTMRFFPCGTAWVNLRTVSPAVKWSSCHLPCLTHLSQTNNSFSVKMDKTCETRKVCSLLHKLLKAFGRAWQLRMFQIFLAISSKIYTSKKYFSWEIFLKCFHN